MAISAWYQFDTGVNEGKISNRLGSCSAQPDDERVRRWPHVLHNGPIALAVVQPVKHERELA
jgi:hypothetical protein